MGFGIAQNKQSQSAMYCFGVEYTVIGKAFNIVTETFTVTCMVHSHLNLVIYNPVNDLTQTTFVYTLHE